MRVRMRVRVHVRVVAVRGWWVLHLERVRYVVAEWQRGARAAAGTTVHCGTNGTFKPARKSTQISSIRKPTEGTEALPRPLRSVWLFKVGFPQFSVCN